MKYLLQCLLLILTVVNISAHSDNYHAGFNNSFRTQAQQHRIASYVARSQNQQPREHYYHKLKRQSPALYDSLVKQTTHIRNTLAALLTSPTIDQLMMACSMQYQCIVGKSNFPDVATVYNTAYHHLCQALLPYLCTSEGIFVGLHAYNHDGSLDSQQQEANVYAVAHIIADFIERADPDHYVEHIKALADKNVPGFKDLYGTLIETDYGFIILNHLEAASRWAGNLFTVPFFLRPKITLETITNNPLNQTIQQCITAFNNNDVAQAYDLLKPYEQNAPGKKSARLHWAIIRNRLQKEIPDYHHRYTNYGAQRHHQPTPPEHFISFHDCIDPFDETIRLFLQRIPHSTFMQTLKEFSLVRNVIKDRYEQGYLPYMACCVGDYVIGLAHGALHTFINTLQLAYDLKHKPMTTLGTACYHLVKTSGLVGLLLTDFAPSEELACYDPFFNEYEVQVKTMIGKTLLSSLECNDPKALGHAIGTLTADMVVQEALLNGARTFYKSMQETAALARECTIGPQLEQAFVEAAATAHPEEALALSSAGHEYPLKMEPPESTIPTLEKSPISSPGGSSEPAVPTPLTPKRAPYIKYTKDQIKQIVEEILDKYKNHPLSHIQEISRKELTKHWGHVFSDAHIKEGLLCLGNTMPEIYEKLIEIIFKKDSLLEISEGLNQFFVIMEEQEVQVRIFVKDRTVLSLDGYLTHGKKGRIFKNN